MIIEKDDSLLAYSILDELGIPHDGSKGNETQAIQVELVQYLLRHILAATQILPVSIVIRTIRVVCNAVDMMHAKNGRIQ